MIQELEAIGNEALKAVQGAQSLETLEQIRVSILGKKGKLSSVLQGLGKVDASERPKIGAAANQWKKKIESSMTERREGLESAELDQKLSKEKIDTTLPSRLPHKGALHPITTTIRRMVEVFAHLGFEVATGPEIDTDFLTFEAVNIPADHPARDMQDTFFVGPDLVLRTHTSPVQIRTMLAKKWPTRIVCPGAVYRCDNDATHSPMFHQIEGLWVDKNVRMSDLKGTLEFFAQELFGSATKIRMRPSYFPFVEPGAEVDVSCVFCKGTGKQSKDTCRVCKGTGWIEILGAGMVHPKLFETTGYDPDEVTGFAFGVGIERVAMLLHRIPDLRMMFQGDARFLRQF